MHVAIFQIREHHRSQVICDSMAAGIAAVGDTVIRRYEDEYRQVDADVVVFYGLEGKLPLIFDSYRAIRKAVYVDLGYWGRRDGGRWTGYHKVVVNDRHPTNYFQQTSHDGRRAAALKVRPQPWRTGEHILLAGMGDKGARAEGFKPEQWERAAIAEIRRHTSRSIIYRPKPSWKAARPIQGVGFSPRKDEVEKVIANCHAVVTHHSNVAVDGLVAGVPAFVWRGVGTCLASQDLSQIERPLRPEGREQFVNDLTYTQWSVAEMRAGAPWRHLKEEGLV